jgi:fumigallin biosynthesis monooxygenase-like protein
MREEDRMMHRVFPGRYTAGLDGDFVVFLIGMRVNRPWKLREWLPVFVAMPRMLRELEQHPEAGLLAYRQLFASPISPVLVQYWRSFEHLERFARDPQFAHLPAWRAFRALTGDDGDVGIWHETYLVRAGEYEAIYGNMPRVGLATAGEHGPIGSSSRAGARLGVSA